MRSPARKVTRSKPASSARSPSVRTPPCSSATRTIEINSSHALILFRIIQECINNVIKHSKSKCIELIVFDDKDRINFKINDTGIGFNMDRVNNGSGLKNLISRAKVINTKFEINSSEKIGTKVLITYNK